MLPLPLSACGTLHNAGTLQPACLANRGLSRPLPNVALASFSMWNVGQCRSAPASQLPANHTQPLGMALHRRSAEAHGDERIEPFICGMYLTISCPTGSQETKTCRNGLTQWVAIGASDATETVENCKMELLGRLAQHLQAVHPSGDDGGDMAWPEAEALSNQALVAQWGEKSRTTTKSRSPRERPPSSATSSTSRRMWLDPTALGQMLPEMSTGELNELRGLIDIEIIRRNMRR
jgi:hypothetical protein